LEERAEAVFQVKELTWKENQALSQVVSLLALFGKLFAVSYQRIVTQVSPARPRSLIVYRRKPKRSIDFALRKNLARERGPKNGREANKRV